jgi:hypothetical protein
MKRVIFFLSILLFKALPAKAICPVCTIAVGAGIGLSRYLGIDDTVSGVWIGGLLVSVSLWTINFLKKKNWNFEFYRSVVFLGYILIIIVPLYFMGIMGHPFNQIWGIDKLLIGIVFGIIVFWTLAFSHFVLKKKNNNKVYFPFQKVVITVGGLVILSGIFYWLTK